jgi:predicted phage tail protein
MIFTVIFAVARSLMQLRSIQRRRMESVANTIAISMAPFMMSSLGIGFLTTIASGIAFIAVCFPTGLALFSLAPAFNSSPELGSMGIIVVIGFSFSVAIWIAAWIR